MSRPETLHVCHKTDCIASRLIGIGIVILLKKAEGIAHHSVNVYFDATY